MRNKLLYPISMFIVGAILGVISKLFDIHTEILGNIFSEFAIWILLGTLISIYSENKKKAMINVFLFSIGMLITYYLMAHITNSVYSWRFIKGWTIFACVSPIFAYFTWMTKEKGTLSIIINYDAVNHDMIWDIIHEDIPHLEKIYVNLLMNDYDYSVNDLQDMSVDIIYLV